MALQHIFTIERLNKKHGTKEVLRDIWLAFYPGAKIGVLGKNGAGKSTLLRIMSGADKDFDGVAKLASGYTAGYVPQEPQLDPTKDVFGNVQDAVASTRALLTPLRRDQRQAVRAALRSRNEQAARRASPRAGRDRLEERLGTRTAGRNCDGRHAVAAGRRSGRDPLGGERRRVALCKMLLQKPDLLLLDEPTNHLDAESVEWLERHLAEYKGTIVAVTHDRYFLDNVAQWILEIDHGRSFPYEGITRRG